MLGLRGIKMADDSLETVYNDRLIPATLLAKIDSLRRENIRELLLASFHDPKLAASKLHEADPTPSPCIPMQWWQTDRRSTSSGISTWRPI